MTTVRHASPDRRPSHGVPAEIKHEMVVTRFNGTIDCHRKTKLANIGSTQVMHAREFSSLREDVSIDLSEMFRQSGCTVMEDLAYQWASNNSRVMSSPIIDLLRVFSGSSEIEAALSFVSITGSSDERLHRHESYLIGIVVGGAGCLFVREEDGVKGKVKRLPLKVGDVLTIPRGASHIVECEPDGKLDLIALEFCDTASGSHMTLGPSSIIED